MAKQVLVGYDGSPQAEAALEHAVAEHADATLVLLCVIDPSETGYSPTRALTSLSEEWYVEAKREAEETLAAGRETAVEAGVDVETDTVVGTPANAIVEYAEDHDVDHVVTGSHGRSGVSRILLGSVAETVIRRSPVPVTVVR